MNQEHYYKQMLAVTKQINNYIERNSHFALSRGEGAILCELKRNPEGLTPGELSKLMQVGTGRIGNALKSMEGKGFILRQNDSEDKRKTVVTLTEEGLTVINSLQKKFDSKMKCVIEKMGQEKFEQYLALSKEFVETFIHYAEKEDNTNA